MVAPTFDALLADVRARSPGATPLERLADAAALRGEVADAAEALLDHFVAESRDAGCSWAQIGAALGVSKQAAQQRAAAPASIVRGILSRLGSTPRTDLGGFFGRMDRAASEAVVAARGLAGALGHHHVGTEHLLLGVLGAGGAAAASLASARVSDASVRAEILARVPGSSEGAAGRLPFTPRARKVIELALRESLRLRADHLGTGHLLLGLLREGEGLAVAILSGLRVDLAALRRDVEERLDPER